MSGARLAAVRSGRWKLHVRPPGRPDYMDQRAPGQWVDPRGPDGVTILAPMEQYGPDAMPGVDSGAPPTPMMLFDLAADPAEQRDVAAQHPGVVRRLQALVDEAERQASVPQRRPPGQPGRTR